jgi:hypothetical protein
LEEPVHVKESMGPVPCPPATDAHAFSASAVSISAQNDIAFDFISLAPLFAFAQ